MSYDVFLLRESEAFPNDPNSIGSKLSAFLEVQDDTYVPSDAQAQLVDKALAEFEAMDPAVGVDLGFMNNDAVFISIAYWDDSVPHLHKIIELLNTVRAELGDGWFFFDPQLVIAVEWLPAQDVQSMYQNVVASMRPQTWRERMGWPEYRSTRQKWIDAAIFALVVAGLLYAVRR